MSATLCQFRLEVGSRKVGDREGWGKLSKLPSSDDLKRLSFQLESVHQLLSKSRSL